MTIHMEFAKRPDDTEIRHRLILTLTKRLDKIRPEDLNRLFNLDGLDLIRVSGAYSFDILIAQSFDVEKVISEIQKTAAELCSDLIIINKEIKT